MTFVHKELESHVSDSTERLETLLRRFRAMRSGGLLAFPATHEARGNVLGPARGHESPDGCGQGPRLLPERPGPWLRKKQ